MIMNNANKKGFGAYVMWTLPYNDLILWLIPTSGGGPYLGQSLQLLTIFLP